MEERILKRFGLSTNGNQIFEFATGIDGDQSFVIRPITGDKEYQACEVLQSRTWGLPWRQVVPSNVFTALEHCQLPVLGVFRSDRSEMLGILFGFLGVKPQTRHPFVHSHMLTVDRKLRSQGIGTAMKIAQAKLCYDLGIYEIEWTVCPLRPNWSVNVRSLGGVTNTYLPALYNFTGAGIYQGYPADRVLLRWSFNSYWALQRLGGERPAVTGVEVHKLPLIETSDDSVIAGRAERVRVEIPPDIDAIWRTKAPKLLVDLVKPGSTLEPWLDRYFGQSIKRQERMRTRPIFTQLFKMGYTAVDFCRTKNRNFVILERDFVLN